MIFCVQGRVTETPKPPMTEPQRRHFLFAVETDHPSKAPEKAQEVLSAQGYGFITVQRVVEYLHGSGDPALDTIVDQARREGHGYAIYR